MEPHTTPNQNMNNTEMPPQMTEASSTESKNTIGPLISIVIIIAVIILGGLYFWMVRGNNESTEQTTNQQTSTQTTSTDSVSDLDASLKATNIDNVDAGLSGVDAAFAQ